ncbi:ESPR-type extended signal peptide-containing protein, partial [Uliginosibacterium sp. sgz301328]|uniref:ESPR-type extended signal peptide-containing protein n=1 Tax=Uliginosibacterium sp. sgz301328 TaxID=3243764 RepID=UPI00359CC8A1
MNRHFRSLWNASRHCWVAVSEVTRSRGKPVQSDANSNEAARPSAAASAIRKGLTVLIGSGVAFASQAANTITLMDEDSVTILGGYKDQAKAGGADPDAKQVPDNYVFNGGTLNLTGGYYRSTGRITVGEGQTGKITGGSSANLPVWISAGSIFNTAPNKSGAMFLLYAPRMAGSQVVLAKDATLEIAFNYEGRNYVAVTNNGNYDLPYTPVVFGENAHIKLTRGTFRFDPYRHDRDVKLSNFIFNGGWLSTRGGDDVITADQDNQAIGKIEMGMGSDTFVLPEGISVTALYVNGVPASEVRMYEFATASAGATDAGTGGLTGTMAEGSGINPSDTVDIQKNASSTDITYNFGYYNDFMTVADGAQLIGGTVDMGNGPDTFTATAATLDGVTIKLADGADTLNLTGTTLKNAVVLDLGNGDDVANLTDLTITPQTATLALGAGNDVANLTNVVVDGGQDKAVIGMGAGTDAVNLVRATIGSAKIDMGTAGTSTVNVMADATGGVSRVTDQLSLTRSGSTAATLAVRSDATLLLSGAIDVAGKIQVDAGGTLAGTGNVSSSDGVNLQGTLRVGADDATDGQITLRDSTGVTARDGAVITGGGVLESSGIALDGTVNANIDEHRSLTYNDLLSGTGALKKNGAGNLSLGGANTYAGGTQTTEGTVTLTHQDGAGIGNVQLDADATLAMDFSGVDTYAVFDNTLSGTGTANVNGRMVDITADNSAFSGTLDVYGQARVTDEVNLGQAAVVIENDGTLDIESPDAFVFANALHGAGLLHANVSGASFAFDAGAGTTFGGTFAIENGTFALEGDNTSALTNATLRMDADSVVTIGQGEQHIDGLTFNGGTAVFDATIPDHNRAEGHVSVATLDAAGTGAVQVSVPDPYVPSVPGTVDTSTLLEQDDGNVGPQLVKAHTVVGSGGALSLLDQNGQAISAQQGVDIAQGGQIVAHGTYDFGMTTSPGDGLYVNYGLREVDLQDSQTLSLTAAPGAAGAATDLAAKVTGDGNLAIAAGAGNQISLSNANSDYRGATTVESGTLAMAANNALGQTSRLDVQDGSAFDMAGYRQRVGELQTATGSTVELAGGTLAIAAGGNADGVLSGSGRLDLEDGTLNVSGSNGGLSAVVGIASAAAARLTHTDGLGTGAIQDEGILALDGATGRLANDISGSGQVELTQGAAVTATGDNSAFDGRFTLDSGTQLTVSAARNLGTASVDNDGALHIASYTDWT